MLDDLKHVSFEMADEGIALATLNRPEKLNAFSPEMRIGLGRILKWCDEDDRIRVLVVTGAGRAFSAGADLSSGERTFRGDRMESQPEPEPLWFLSYRLRKPVIGAINGHAVGMGLTIPLNWDILVVSEDAKLAFPFVRRGIVPEAGSTWLLSRMVGLRRALELMLTGRTFSGADAVRWGLAQESVPAESVLPRALELAREIRDQCAPVSIALTKRMMWEHMMSNDLPGAVVREGKNVRWTGRQEDVKEGVMAFLEKRRPRWTMRPSVDWPEHEAETG